jgi:hypothetical protein
LYENILNELCGSPAAPDPEESEELVDWKHRMGSVLVYPIALLGHTDAATELLVEVSEPLAEEDPFPPTREI